MRRLTQKRIRSYYLRKRTATKDKEGVPIESFGEAVMVRGEVWPAKDTRQVEQYGDRISGIQNMRLEGPYKVTVENGIKQVRFIDLGYTLSLGDGVCVNAAGDETPDYQVLSFTNYYPVLMEVERRV